MVRDLRADIAAEAGARQTYEVLIKLSPDEGSKKALTFLLTREILHTQMSMNALDSGIVPGSGPRKFGRNSPEMAEQYRGERIVRPIG